MGKVTEADLGQCREAFDALDVDGSGWLSASDLALLRRQRSAKARTLKSQRTRKRYERRLEDFLRARSGGSEGREQDE